MKIIIENMAETDWDQVVDIYEQGILTGNATFEQEIPDRDSWDAGHLKACRLVAKSNSSILGWAALSPVSNRRVYRGVAEVSVYVGAEYKKQGVGKLLMQALIQASENAGIWTLQAGIFPENKASIDLHKQCGFRKVGYREKIGKMSFGDYAGTWRDTIFLERRSGTAGTQ